MPFIFDDEGNYLEKNTPLSELTKFILSDESKYLEQNNPKEYEKRKKELVEAAKKTGDWNLGGTPGGEVKVDRSDDETRKDLGETGDDGEAKEKGEDVGGEAKAESGGEDAVPSSLITAQQVDELVSKVRDLEEISEDEKLCWSWKARIEELSRHSEDCGKELLRYQNGIRRVTMRLRGGARGGLSVSSFLHVGRVFFRCDE